jgi:hypothetical protein
MGVRKTHALLREPIDVGRTDFTAIAAQISPTQIVCQDDDDVRRRAARNIRSCGHGRCRDAGDEREPNLPARKSIPHKQRNLTKAARDIPATSLF